MSLIRSGKRVKKSGILTTVLLVLVFLVGLALLLYPTISNYWNSLHQSQAIVNYDQELDQLTEETYARLWAEAEEWNRTIAHRSFTLTDEQSEVYYDLLDFSDQNIMGYLEIPSIGVSLPVGHGTGDDVLQRSVGHLEWSSLPVGGESTHCVLSGHRGLPSSELLTNIDHLEPGDRFYIHVLGETLEYKVDNIAVVEPNDFSLLGIAQGEDYVTLLTCTPYGINSHRLLVRGTRVNTDNKEPSAVPQLSNEVREIKTGYLVAGVLLAVLVLVFIWLIIDSRRKKKKKGGKRLRGKDQEIWW